MAGISGHAGLFSNTSDMAVLLQLMLNKGGYGKTTIFDQASIDLFTASSDTNPTYGLGWRKTVILTWNGCLENMQVTKPMGILAGPAQ